MIYVTGDTHGCPERLSENNIRNINKKYNIDFPVPGSGDTLIIAGDFGCVWNKSGKAEYWLDWLAEKPYTTVFCDGNHEDFNLLYSYPVKLWNGGLVHEIRPNIFHLMRGEIFTIEDKTFFIFGGAESVDRKYRTEGISWWKEEVCSADEIINAKHNLEKVNYTVDYVITHTSPKRFLYNRGKFIFDKPIFFTTCPVMEFLSEIEPKMNYTKWFFGHFHKDLNNRNMKCRAIYTDLTIINYHQ